MRRLSPFVLHATAAGVMVWGHLGALQQPHMRLIESQKGGYSQFLTHHGLVYAVSYMVVSLICDVFPSMPVIGHLKRTLLMISMPLAAAISIMYWSLCFVTPPTLVPRLPLMMDLAVHSWPLFCLLSDFFIFEPKFSRMYVHKAAPVAAIVLPVWYASFLEYCATFNGSFPYPFLTFSPFAVRVLIYVATTGVIFSCFRTLNALHA